MKSKNALFILVVLAVLLAAMESLFYVTGRVLQSKWAMWRVPAASEATQSSLSFAQYMERRDPVLGWPFPVQSGQDLEKNGAQRNSRFPQGPRDGGCVSLYGDSFTQGGDTSSIEKNWGNVLSDQLACYVANFGMGGYGSDQAYLRFERNENDTSPVVIFGFHTDDVLRNLTRLRDLQAYERTYALKPRFIVNEKSGLDLVPIPSLSEQQYLQVLGASSEVLPLEHENFQPGGPAGVVKLEFPYSVSVARNMLRFYGFHARLFRRPEWMEFLQKDHPLHGLEITVGITRKFVDLARQRGRKPLVVILPHPLDFKHFDRKGSWPYQTVVDEYGRNSIPFVDFGPYLIAAARASGKSLEEFFGKTGHYNDEGNALVARFMDDKLKEQGLMPPGN